jgi:hypothetical protein
VTKGELGPSSHCISSSSALLWAREGIVLTGSLLGVPNCMGEGDFVEFRKLAFAGDSGVAIVENAVQMLKLLNVVDVAQSFEVSLFTNSQMGQ